MNKKNIKISCLLIVFIFLFSIFYFLFFIADVSATPTSTQTDTNANINISCTTYGYPWCQEGAKNPGGLIARFYQIALGLAGAAALAVLIYGAILWTVSGAVTSKQDAMQWISAALWGLALLLAAYLILYTINPDLVNLGSGEKLFQPIQKAVQQKAIEPLVRPLTPGERGRVIRL